MIDGSTVKCGATTSDSPFVYWADTIMAGNAVPEIEDGLTSIVNYGAEEMTKELLAHRAFHKLGAGTKLDVKNGAPVIVHKLNQYKRAA